MSPFEADRRDFRSNSFDMLGPFDELSTTARSWRRASGAPRGLAMSKRKNHPNAELMAALRRELAQVERAIRTLERMGPRNGTRKKLSLVGRPGAK